MTKEESSKVLTQLRGQAGMSQADLARRWAEVFPYSKNGRPMEMSTQQLSAWETGNQGMTLESMGRYLHCCELSWGASDTRLSGDPVFGN